jgi:CRISPR/Cas system-associated endonuclease/helicase Cas3
MDRKKCRRIVRKVSRLLLVQIAEVLEEKIAREKKAWVKKWLARRSTHGGSALLLKELYAEDPAEYHACWRMSPECFDTT